MPDQIQKISVISKVGDPKEKHVKHQIKEFLHTDIHHLKIIKNFYVQGLSELEAVDIAKNVLSCPITEEYVVNGNFYDEYTKKLEIAFQPGVMNPETETVHDNLVASGYGLKATAVSFTYCFKES